MGKTDHLTRKYWHDHPESFAEAFNVFVFGKKIIDPKLLRPLDPNFLYRSNGAIREKQRDNLRSAEVRQYGNSFLVLLGIEDSSYVDYTAPVRQMMYDSLSYLRQISAFRKDALRGDEWLSGFPKTGKLHPVCTLYYYWGNRKWDGPRSLHDMIDSGQLPRLNAKAL